MHTYVYIYIFYYYVYMHTQKDKPLSDSNILSFVHPCSRLSLGCFKHILQPCTAMLIVTYSTTSRAIESS